MSPTALTTYRHPAPAAGNPNGAWSVPEGARLGSRDAAHTEPPERAVSAGRELGWRARAEQRTVQVVEPANVAVKAPALVIGTTGIATDPAAAQRHATNGVPES